MLLAVDIGILGGTFDPPHMAHLFAGQAGYEELHLNVVHFVPAGAPWQKADRRVSDAEHRLEMTRLACEGVSHFHVDDREVRRDGWTYTADTLASYDPDIRLTLILGSDTAIGLDTWERTEEVRQRARIAVMPRPGVDREAVEAAAGGGDLVWLDTPQIYLSGTLLRQRVARGQSIRFLVPDAVEAYIRRHGLYRDGEG